MPRILSVLINGTNDVVEIDLENLPPVEAVIGVLQNELAHLPYFQVLALEYLKQDKINECVQLLEASTDPAAAAMLKYPSFLSDRISCYVSLAALHILRLLSTNSQAHRDTIFMNASLYLSQAETLDHSSELMRLGTAVSNLAKGDITQAKIHVNSILQTSSTHLAGNYLFALISLSSNNFQDALLHLRTCLSQCLPDRDEIGSRSQGSTILRPFIYVLLSYTFAALGDLRKARLALNECSKYSTDFALFNTVSFYVSILENSLEVNESHLEFLKEALKLSTKSPTTLTILAKILIENSDYSAAFAISREVSGLCVAPSNLIECKYYEGIANQFFDRFGDASLCFHTANDIAAQQKIEYFPAIFGYIQTNYLSDLSLGASSITYPHLLNLSSKLTTSLSVTRLLVHRYLREKNHSAALDLISKLIKEEPWEATNWLLFGEVNTFLLNFDRAFDAYEKAYSLSVFNNTTLSYQTTHNLGVLALLQSNLSSVSKPLNFLQIALNTANSLGVSTVQTRFAMGKVLEVAGREREAVDIYKELVVDAPYLVQSYLRLAALDATPATQQGLRWLKLGIYGDPFSVELRNSIGNHYLKRKMTREAHDVFKQTVDLWRIEPYAALSLGNVYLKSARALPSESEDYKTEEKRKQLIAEHSQKYLSSALQYYYKVLEWRRYNSFAASGIAAVLGDLGQHQEATRLLTRIRETSPVIASRHFTLWVNLGHAAAGVKDVRSALKHYLRAAALLKSSVKSLDQSSLSFIELTAQVYQSAAKVLVGDRQYGEAIRYLSKSVKLAPHLLDLVVDHNIVICLEAKRIQEEFSPLQKTTLERELSLFDLQRAMALVNSALRYASGAFAKFSSILQLFKVAETGQTHFENETNYLGLPITQEYAAKVLSGIHFSHYHVGYLMTQAEACLRKLYSLSTAVAAHVSKQEEENDLKARLKLEEEVRKQMEVEEKAREEQLKRQAEMEQALRDKERLERITTTWAKEPEKKKSKIKRESFSDSEEPSYQPVNPDIMDEIHERSQKVRKRLSTSKKETKRLKKQESESEDEESNVELGEEATLSDLE
ncbi:hypothetical protein RCL1_002280 [Eukaryota sp. TZLM3-RCL]